MTERLTLPEGSWVALVTPFDKNGDVNMDCFRELVDFHVANGTDGLLFMGSTGESPSLTMEERCGIITEMTAYCREKIPAFHGVTCSTTSATVAPAPTPSLSIIARSESARFLAAAAESPRFFFAGLDSCRLAAGGWAGRDFCCATTGAARSEQTKTIKHQR